MKTNAEIRLINARLLMAEAGGQKQMIERTGKSQSQISQLMGENPRKPIGPRIARQLEKAFGKEEGWMDVEHAEGGGNAVAGSATVHGVGKVINPPPEIGQLISQLSQKGRRDVLESLSRELSVKDAAWAAVLFSSRAQELLERGDT